MQTRTFFASDIQRRIAPGAQVRVYLPGTATPVPVFDALGAEIAQPLIADAAGRVDVRTWNGAVDIAFSGDGIAQRLNSVQFFDPGAAPLRAFASVAEAEASQIPATVIQIETMGYRTPGDRGGARYIRVGAAPAHTGWIASNAAGVFWELAQPAASPEVFGGWGDGASDDLPALNAAAVWQDVTGGTIELRSFVYGISDEWVLSHEDVTVRTANGTGHNSGAEHASTRAVIQKLPGFAGECGIRIANGVNGALIVGVYLNGGDFVEPDGGGGSYGDGNGFHIGQASNVTMVDCQAQNHKGYGFVIDGAWVLKTYGCVTRKNGVKDEVGGNHTGGGLLYTNEFRESANHDHFGLFSTGNYGHDVLMLDGPDPTDRANAIHFHGGQLESGGVGSHACVEIRAGTRVTFSMTGIASAVGAVAPCVILGTDAYGSSPVDVRFESVYFQHDAAGPGWAVVAKAGIVRAEFVCPIFTVLRSKFLNVEDMPASGPGGLRPLVHVIGGNIPSTHYRDPLRLVALTGTEDVTAGMRAGGLGVDAYFGPSIPGRRTKLGYVDTGGGEHSLHLGLGSGENLAHLGDMFMSLAPKSAEPNVTGLDALRGIIALADGVADGGWDPLGVGLDKPYLVWTFDGGASWARIGDPAT